MKKGIGAIEAQIDSVTAYREREKRQRPIETLGQWEEEERARDRELRRAPKTRIVSIQGEQFDEPFGYCE